MSEFVSKVWEAPEGQTIVEAYPQEHRVSSDHSMLDTGSGFRVNTWDGAHVHTYYISTGWPGENTTMPKVGEVPESIREQVKAYRAAATFISDIYYVAEQAHYIRSGMSTVTVFKGRKCPKGTYEVVGHRDGQYGPYCNLRDKTGKYYNFISIDNLKIVPDYNRELASRSAIPDDIRPFLVSVIMSKPEDRPAVWGVLADYIQTQGVEFQYSDATYFAESLRLIAAIKQNENFSTYHADCHNAFRRPFAGV